MPGIASLRLGQYYGHGRNLFWPIVFELFGKPCPPEYETRTAFLLEKGIALWDVLDSCERRTSADSDIREPQPNDIAGLLAQNPAMGAVFFNGNGAAELFRRHVAPKLTRPVPLLTLPSTSPAHAVARAEKLAGWQALRIYLQNTKA